MREGTRGSTGKSSELLWETLEKTIRGKVQEFIQEILEEEVTDFLGGRRKSQRKSSAEGDFELALRGLLGDGAPLSKSTVRRLREKWIAEHAEWECRSLAGREIVYAWADGIYVKAGLEKDKAALLVIIGAMADGTKEVLAVASGFRESAESWAGVLRGLRARGLGVPKLLVADGNLGIWAAARQVWPEAGEQRCWNHKMVNVLDRLPKREQKRAKALLREVVYAESGAAAEAARERFEDRYGGDYPKAAETMADDWDRMTALAGTRTGVRTSIRRSSWTRLPHLHRIVGPPQTLT